MSSPQEIKEPSLDFKIKPWYAYKFEPDDIKRLSKVASSYTGQASTISVYFANGNSVSSEDPSVCLEDSNSLTSLVTNITISSSNYRLENGSRSVSIDLTKSTISNIAQARGSGPRSASVVVRSEIESIFVSSSTWYSFIYYSAFIQGAIIFAIAEGLYFYLINDFKKPIATDVQIFMGLICGVVVMFPVPYLITTLYPRVSFDIGLGAKRSAIRRKAVAFLIITVGCGLLIGVGGNFLTDRLKGNPIATPEARSVDPNK